MLNHVPVLPPGAVPVLAHAAVAEMVFSPPLVVAGPVAPDAPGLSLHAHRRGGGGRISPTPGLGFWGVHTPKQRPRPGRQVSPAPPKTKSQGAPSFRPCRSQSPPPIYLPIALFHLLPVSAPPTCPCTCGTTRGRRTPPPTARASRLLPVFARGSTGSGRRWGGVMSPRRTSFAHLWACLTVLPSAWYISPHCSSHSTFPSPILHHLGEWRLSSLAKGACKGMQRGKTGEQSALLTCGRCVRSEARRHPASPASPASAPSRQTLSAGSWISVTHRVRPAFGMEAGGSRAALTV